MIPKGYLGWIWTLGVLSVIGLVIYTLITDTSPFEKMGLDPGATTIVFAVILVVLLIIPMVFKKK